MISQIFDSTINNDFEFQNRKGGKKEYSFTPTLISYAPGLLKNDADWSTIEFEGAAVKGLQVDGVNQSTLGSSGIL